MDEEVDLSKEEVDEVRLMRATPTFCKKGIKIVERLTEGGAFMMDQADNTTPWNAATLEILATMRTVERRKEENLATINQKLINYTTDSDYEDYHGGMFKVKSMSVSIPTNTSSLEYVWFVDSIASNNITSHEEWFCDS